MARSDVEYVLGELTPTCGNVYSLDSQRKTQQKHEARRT